MKVGSRVKQVGNRGGYSVSQIGWLGTIKKVLINGMFDVKFDNEDELLRVQGADLAVVSAAENDRLTELVRQANAARPIFIALANEFPGMVYYNSSKHKKGEKHLCEKFSRIIEFELVTDKKERVLNPFNVSGLQVRLDGERLFIGSTSFLIGDLQFNLRELIAGNVVTAGSFSATRNGLTFGQNRITWAEAEQIAEAISTL